MERRTPGSPEVVTPHEPQCEQRLRHAPLRDASQQAIAGGGPRTHQRGRGLMGERVRKAPNEPGVPAIDGRLGAKQPEVVVEMDGQTGWLAEGQLVRGKRLDGLCDFFLDVVAQAHDVAVLHPARYSRGAGERPGRFHTAADPSRQPQSGWRAGLRAGHRQYLEACADYSPFRLGHQRGARERARFTPGASIGWHASVRQSGHSEWQCGQALGSGRLCGSNACLVRTSGLDNICRWSA